MATMIPSLSQSTDCISRIFLRPFLAIAVCGLSLPISLVYAASDLPALQVTTDFPSGSASIQSIDQKARVIHVKPAEHPDHGWPCWWYFKVSGIKPGEVITVDLSGDNFALADQATFSTDRQSWLHTARGERTPGEIVYQQQIDARQAWFAWGPPFTWEDASQLVHAVVEKCPQAKSFELCQSRGGRPVVCLQISPASSEHAAEPLLVLHGVWIVARQHAWESGGSWVCRGLVEWLVSDDSRAISLRKKADFHIVPVMDVDNVALGAGGKEERPQDHNRDWTAEPYHPAVAALQREILKTDNAGQFDIFIDLHNPGPSDKSSFFFISPRSILSDEGWTNIQTFLQAAQAEMTGPLPIRGPPRESGPGYDARWKQIGKNWVTLHTARHVVSLTLETTWNTPDGTTAGFLTTGKQLGLAIERYFREPPKKATTE